MKACAIITAAGIGRRMRADRPKQFLELAGRPIIIHTLEAFQKAASIDSLVIVTEPSWLDQTTHLIKTSNIDKPWKVVAGGAERQDSVRNGLNAIPNDAEIVAIHDGVRPFIDPSLIDASVEHASKEGGCIIAIPVRDTLKKANGTIIVETVDRSDLWAAQTPQTFRTDILRRAFKAAEDDGFLGTDDASLVERLGLPIHLLTGHSTNIKITSPEDIQIGEAILKMNR